MRNEYRLLIIFCLMTLSGCPNPPDIVDQNTSIVIDEIEIWTTTITLRVAVEDTTEGWHFTLSRDDSIIHSGYVVHADTQVVDMNLTMGVGYSYRAYFTDGEAVLDSSEQLFLTTIGTTTHDVIWSVDTLGLPGSLFNDVQMISENEFWVVGEIVLPDPDSSYDGSGKEWFNAGYWNGDDWEWVKTWSVDRRYAIQFFSEDDIWVTSAAFPMHWDGDEWTLFQLEHMGIDVAAGLDIWAQDEQNIFFTGYDGAIVKYNGSNFIEINSGGEIDYLGVDGNSKNLMVTGFNRNNGDSQILKVSIETNTLEEVYFGHKVLSGGTPDWYAGPLTAVTSIDDNRFLFCSQYGVYLLDDRDLMRTTLLPINKNDLSEYFLGFPRAIVANGINDVFVVGDRSGIYHFNGDEFYRYPDQFENATYYGVSMVGEKIVAVGRELNTGRAIIAKGEKL